MAKTAVQSRPGGRPSFTLRARLRELRHWYGETHGQRTPSQAEFADLIGFGAKAYGTWEKGVVPNNWRLIAEQIADRADCDLGYLIDDLPPRGPAVVDINTRRRGRRDRGTAASR